MVYQINLIAKLINLYIVEYSDAGVEKAKITRKSSGALFPEKKLCKWLTQLLLAIDYLHSNHVIHTDVKVILDSQTFSIEMALLPQPFYEIMISTLDKPKILFRVIQLRKACSHPHLFGGIESEPYKEGEHLVQGSGKLLILDHLLQKLHACGHKVLIFSQMTQTLDILQVIFYKQDWNPQVDKQTL